MIRYRYADLQPPAPIVVVSLRCPFQGASCGDLLALLDTGADRSVIPDQVIQSMGLVPTGSQRFQGFGSTIHELPLYLVDLVIHAFPAIRIQPTLGVQEPYFILGRDVLNHFRLVLDGPNLALELHHPQSSGE